MRDETGENDSTRDFGSLFPELLEKGGLPVCASPTKFGAPHQRQNSPGMLAPDQFHGVEQQPHPLAFPDFSGVKYHGVISQAVLLPNGQGLFCSLQPGAKDVGVDAIGNDNMSLCPGT